MAKVLSIHVGNSGVALNSVSSVRAVAGRGLEGDRYFAKAGTFSKKEGADREVTLIESEAIEALKRDYEVDLAAAETRRNIVTRGVALNHLVGTEFSVGDAVFKGLRLCEPCGHLAKLTSERVRQGLIHRGGLRACVVKDGTIRAGDTIAPARS